MALPNWQRTITDSEGNVVPSAEITVLVEATGLHADLFEDREGNTGLSNPFNTGTDGFAEFYVAAGTYRVVAESAIGTRTWRYESILDPATDITFTGNNSHSGTENFTGPLQLDGTSIVEEFQRFTMEEKRDLGEVFTLMDYREPSAWDAANPRDYFAGICLDSIDGHTDIADANYPDLVPYLRARKSAYREGTASEKTQFDVTAYDITSNVATLTFGTASSDPEQFIIDALLEDEAVHGSFTDWRTIELPSAIGPIDAGVYAITVIDSLNREVEFAYTAADDSDTVTAVAEFPLHKIPGEAAQARLFEASGRTIVSANDSDDEYVSGLRRRDEMQQITGSIEQNADRQTSYAASGALSRTTLESGAYDGGTSGQYSRYDFDSANSPDARTSDKTNPRALAAHVYLWARRYVA